MSKTSVAGATSIGHTSNSYYENDTKTIWLTFFQSSDLNTEAAAQRRLQENTHAEVWFQ